MIVLWVILGIVVLLLLAAILPYNRFVSQRNLIRNAWANIDTELRRRYDLIPNLVETVKGYAAHEREVFEDVARTRSAAAATSGQSPAAQAAAEGPFVANSFGFKEEEFFEIPEAERAVVGAAPRVDFESRLGGIGDSTPTPPA